MMNLSDRNVFRMTAVSSRCQVFMDKFCGVVAGFNTLGHRLLRRPVLCGFKLYVGRHLRSVPDGSIVFFPCSANTLCCGLAGIVSIMSRGEADLSVDFAGLQERVEKIAGHDYLSCIDKNWPLEERYLCGDDFISSFLNSIKGLKKSGPFFELYNSAESQQIILNMTRSFSDMIAAEEEVLAEHMGRLELEAVETLAQRIENLKDIHWYLSSEVTANISKIKDLLSACEQTVTPTALRVYREVNAILNSLDRLEVRGRDSAGISLLFVLDDPAYKNFMAAVDVAKLADAFSERAAGDVLSNNHISINEFQEGKRGPGFSVTLTYKIAAEIGSLGDNVGFLRDQIQNDAVLQILMNFPHRYHTVLSHTRWASVGAITEANCHPVDNDSVQGGYEKSGVIHVCLNGDIDNFRQLKAEMEKEGHFIHQEITSDTKIIPLQVDRYIKQGNTVEEAFRLAVNDFDGSHAISMHTDLAPGKLFLAQKGSGQAIFVGLSDEHFMATSEVYGFVEETSDYLKMDGETIAEGRNGKTQGQIFILDQASESGPKGIKAMFYDGTPVLITEADVKHTEITSRDIDRQDFPHYFLKEISEAPLSVERTLLNRWKFENEAEGQAVVSLDETVIPDSIMRALRENRIKRAYFVGQGTAGVAAAACSELLNYYMNDPSFQTSALKASEFSGFKIDENAGPDSMSDTLIIAISQSGTTTDTNRTVDMARERGAHIIAIVNRRDSDITFKADGVMYTSSGRDIEMSVASTKAFYSQIVAGALLGLFIASLKERRDKTFVAEEIRQLLEIPSHMGSILSMKDTIKASAARLAVTKTYWAVVGSGPNKVAADEIRIKLSELCYKTISSDFVEDKKHIDLSSEPLIIICAAGTRSTVAGDIIKDTAIFQAHKATPVVIADEGDDRFDPYAEDVFHIPVVSEHLALILNTLVGHIWGYYAALAINDGSGFLYRHREEIRDSIEVSAEKGLDVYEAVLERSFKEKIARFYNDFRKAKTEKRLPTVMGMDAASDLTLLLKYLAGRLPVSDFEIDFGVKGTAMNMLSKLFECLGTAVNDLARPVDAIKHQAKTVTVGTSRLREKIEGVLFEALEHYDLSPSQLINRNIVVLKNLQNIVAGIKGAILYRISGLDVLGELTDETKIEVLRKEGVLKPIPSRVEKDTGLKGTKRIIVKQGNVYIGKGRKDNRSILMVPFISSSPAAPNRIEHLLLLNISFKPDVSLSLKIKALGGKYEHIKNIVQENSIAWEDLFLETVPMEKLFGRSAEKVSESIVSSVNGKTEKRQ